MAKKRSKNKHKNKNKNKYVPDVIYSYSHSKKSHYGCSPHDINVLAYEVFGSLHYQVSGQNP